MYLRLLMVLGCGGLFFTSANVTHGDDQSSGKRPATVRKAKVEFRWLEANPVEGLTSQKVKMSCAEDDYRYAHIKPVLTHTDVAKARMSKLDYPGLGVLYSVHFRLSRGAQEKLVKACPENEVRMLGVFVDGKDAGAWVFRPTSVNKFRPMAGFRKSKTWAEQIVAACEQAKP